MPSRRPSHSPAALNIRAVKGSSASRASGWLRTAWKASPVSTSPGASSRHRNRLVAEKRERRAKATTIIRNVMISTSWPRPNDGGCHSWIPSAAESPLVWMA